VDYEIEWTESALVSLSDVVDYISRYSTSYAAAFAMRAQRAAESLKQMPQRGRRVTEFDDADVRELRVANYRLLYHVRARKVVLLAFVHEARDLDALLHPKMQ
jgi:toxin ParE1/3/4